MDRIVPMGYLLGCLIMSLLTLAIYGWDKRQARLGGRRVPERRLHAMAWLGGWPGGILGQRWFRHKTRKPAFYLVFGGAAALHLTLIAAWCFWVWN